MTRKIDVVIACLNAVGVKPSIVNFENRLVIQKVMYLLQKLGVNTGFTYGLYAHGPYSPALAMCLYEHKAALSGKSGYELNSKEAQAASQLKEIGFTSTFLEVMSTYLCLSSDLHKSEDEAITRLKELKPFISEADVAVGISKAKQLTFKPTADDLAWLKRQNAALEAASGEAIAKVERLMRNAR